MFLVRERVIVKIIAFSLLFKIKERKKNMTIKEKLLNSKVDYGFGVAGLKTPFQKELTFGEFYLNYTRTPNTREVYDLGKAGWKHSQDKQKAEYFQTVKKNLPWFTLTSADRRNGKFVENPFIILDIDNLELNSVDNEEKYWDRLFSFPFVLAGGISCSSTGFYIIVPFSEDIEEESEFKEMFETLKEVFNKEGFELDNSCKNINRTRLASYGEFRFNGGFKDIYKPVLKPREEHQTVVAPKYNFSINQNEEIVPFNGELHTDDIVKGEGGNWHRIQVASCIKKYFPKDYEKIIIDSFPKMTKDDIEEMLGSTKYKQSGVEVSRIVERWCFDNLDIFKVVKNKRNICWNDNKIELSEKLNEITKDLIDKTYIIKDGEHFGNVFNDLKGLGNKLIINSPCGSGKTYWIIEELEKNDNIKVFAPYKSIEEIYIRGNKKIKTPWGETKEDSSVKAYNIQKFRASEIKRGETIILDEAHLLMVDSQYREVVNEFSKILDRKDINVLLFTGTPTKDFISSLKDKNFKYFYFEYEDKTRYKNTEIINLVVNEKKTSDNLVRSVKYLIENEGQKYDAVLICTDLFHDLFRRAKIVKPERDICSENIDKYEEVRRFCKGIEIWKGVYLCTKYVYSGIDYKWGGNYLIIQFNNDMNLVDEIQLFNRFRKGEVSIINIMNGDYIYKEPKINNNIFSQAYKDFLKWSVQNPISYIGVDDYINTCSSLDNKGLNYLKKAKFYWLSKIKNNNGDLYLNGVCLKRKEQSIKESWLIAPKDLVGMNYNIYESVLKVRETEDDINYCKYIFKYDKVLKMEECLELVKDKDDEIKIKNLLIEKTFGNRIIFSGWDLIKNLKGRERDNKILDLIKSEDPRVYISEEYKNKNLNGKKGKEFKMEVDYIIRIVGDINESVDIALKFKNNYTGNTTLKNILNELGKNEGLAYNTGDPEKWFNKEVEIVVDGVARKIRLHDVRTDKKGKAVGKAVGKSLNYKYEIIGNPSIKFYKREEAFNYCCKNCGYDKSYKSFQNRDIWNYLKKI